jgi:hypothetical protein
VRRKIPDILQETQLCCLATWISVKLSANIEMVNIRMRATYFITFQVHRGRGGVRVGHWTFIQRVLDLTKVRSLCKVSANRLEPTHMLHIKLWKHQVPAMIKSTC